jgi:hypothetical protein
MPPTSDARASGGAIQRRLTPTLLVAEEEGDQLFTIAPWNLGEGSRGHHHMTGVLKKVFAGCFEMHVLVLSVQRERLVGCKVDALPEPDGLALLIQFESPEALLHAHLQPCRPTDCNRQTHNATQQGTSLETSLGHDPDRAVGGHVVSYQNAEKMQWTGSNNLRASAVRLYNKPVLLRYPRADMRGAHQGI